MSMEIIQLFSKKVPVKSFRVSIVLCNALATAAIFFTLVNFAQSGSLEGDLLNPETSANCAVSGHRVFNPGLSTVPSRGTWFADVPTDINCYGTLGGERLAGPAEIELGGTYGEPSLTTPEGDTCQFGRMFGDIVGRFQTVDGKTLKFRGQLEFIRTGLTLTAEGIVSSGNMDVYATAQIYATPDIGQDCITTPITGVNIVATAQLRSAN